MGHCVSPEALGGPLPSKCRANLAGGGRDVGELVAKEFRLPDIGEGLTEAEIVRWLGAEGERIKADQPLVEVETDKAVVEIPSPYAGTVLRHGGAEGQTLEVGAVLVVIGELEEGAAPAQSAVA